MVEDVEKIVSRYNKLRSEEPLLDERIALERAFYSEDFIEPIEVYHTLVFDFIDNINNTPNFVEDFFREDISRKPSVHKKLEKARQAKFERYKRKRVGVSKRTPEAQALKKYHGITPETATQLLPEEIKIGETITPIKTSAITQPFEIPTIPTISGLTDRQMTPVASSFVKGVGAYKGHLLIEYHHDPNIWGYPVGGEQAGNFFNEIMMSGSKGGWVWDKLLGKPSIYGMEKGKFFAYQDPNSNEMKYYTTPGAQFVHLEGRPVKFTYNPVGYMGGESFYDQQSEVWKEYKEKIVEPPKSREPAEIELIKQQQEKEAQLMEELRVLFKQQGLDFTEDVITKILDESGAKHRILMVKASAPAGEPNFVYLRVYDDEGELLDTIELDTKKIIELGEEIKAREVKKRGIKSLLKELLETQRENPENIIDDIEYYIKETEDKSTKELLNELLETAKENPENLKADIKYYIKKEGKGKDWWGDPEGHSQAAKKGKKDLIEDIEVGRWVTIKGNHVFIPSKPLIKEMEGGNLTHKHDFIDFSNFKTDFTEDYTIMYGPITHGRKGGHFDYRDPNDPKKIIRVYKDYENLKEVHNKLDYYPVIGTQGKGSHRANVIGFVHKFEPRNDTEEIYGETVLFNDLIDISDIPSDVRRQVSIGFEDEIIGDTQYIKSIDHQAMSLDNDEIGKCLMGGNDCFMEVKTDMGECPYGITPVLSGLRQVITITNRGELKN